MRLEIAGHPVALPGWGPHAYFRWTWCERGGGWLIGGRALKVTLQIFALLISTGTFLPLVRSDIWVIRGWDFPRLQLFVAGVFVMAGLLFLGGNESGWDIASVVTLSIALAALAVWMSRYTPLRTVSVLNGEGKTTMRVLVSNVLMSNRNSADLLNLVREYEPDILVAVEIDSWWKDQLAMLASVLPHAVEVPQNDTYGMVVRSSLPLVDPKVERIVRKNIPSVHAQLRLADGTLVQFHAVHPKPPFPDEDTTSTDRDAELLIVARRVKAKGGPTIVLGDLNDVAWSRTTRLFEKTSGLLDPRIGRGFFNTFHAGHWWMRWPLDHVFISPHFCVREIKRLQLKGSDHFAMFVEFSYEPKNPGPDEVQSADAGEREEVNEKIEKAR
jgi:endonuclease/exonuclease/phosphatase (EEP) superfamily protein YafD